MKYSREQILAAVRTVFSKYDMNQDGYLDRDEIKLFMNEIFKKLHARELNKVEMD